MLEQILVEQSCAKKYSTGALLHFITQSKSKILITRSVHGKFNCITVKYDGTQHGIVINLDVTSSSCNLLYIKPIQGNRVIKLLLSSTIELTVHTSCDCVLDLFCVMQCSTIVTGGNDKSSIKRTF